MADREAKQGWVFRPLPPRVIEYLPDLSEEAFNDNQEHVTSNVPNLAISETNKIVRTHKLQKLSVKILTITQYS